LGTSLKHLLSDLVPELEEKLKLREETFSSTRRVTVLSKQAVMAIHAKDLESAAARLEEASCMLQDLERRLSDHPDLRRESANIAYQEYSEARFLEAATTGKGYPSPATLHVPTVPFILGVADVVGEFRRRAVEALTRLDLSEAESSLKIMEEIYRELLPLEFYYSLAPELRRKVDVARHLIEATMGDIYTEKRRSSLEATMRSLEKRLEGDRLQG
jgi:translin